MAAPNIENLGAFIRYQRKRAQLSLRELAKRTEVSDPYLSQIERGLHEPSIHVLKSIAKALGLPARTLLAIAAGLSDEEDGPEGDRTTSAILGDPQLSDDQRQALLSVYRSYVAANDQTGARVVGLDAPKQAESA